MSDKQNKTTPAATEVEIEKHLKDLPESVRIALLENIKKTKSAEITIGIDPESYLAKEIFWQSQKIIRLTHSINELKVSLNMLTHQLKKNPKKEKWYLALIQKVTGYKR
ncbi:MAG: hypothetical protein ACQEWS_13600 [Bacillota bacterium]